jgi:mannosyltransferase
LIRDHVLPISNQQSTIQNPKFIILLVLILALAAFLRFYLLDGQSFWNDEGNSARIAERSLQLVTEGAAGDIHPPLYYYMLHFWRGVFGSSEFALRSLSAVLGVLLVGLTFLIGCKAFSAGVGLLAAFVAAINPFQIYYSQEARMYMLLAVIGAAATFFLLRLLKEWAIRDQGSGRRFSLIIDHCLLIIFYALGLYTHYAFPFIFVTHFFIVLMWTLVTRAKWKHFIVWIGLVAAAGVLFLPWLPTAIRQLTTWPSARVTIDGWQMLLDTLRLYVAGPTLPTAEATWAIVICGLFILFGLWNPIGFDERRAESHDVLPYSIRLGSIVLWWLVPIALIFAFGLFKESYLKFFIVGSAAFCILLARGISNAWGIGRGALHMPRELAGQPRASWAWSIVVLALCAVIAVPTFTALRNYYYDPTYARDDYRSIAQRILQQRRPDDAVILDSANQWEVFTYYYPDSPNVYTLPRQRPLDQIAVETELAEIAAKHPRLYVLYWGDGEADPQHVIESWLDTHTYVATEQWINSIRFATYAVPAKLSNDPEVKSGARFGKHIALEGYTLSTSQVQPGDIVQLDLFWRTDAPLSERYKVFVHVLDQNGKIIAQADREPGGGQRPTTNWETNEQVIDRYGVLIPEDTPPGVYKVEVGLYDFAGARLPLNNGGDSLGLIPIVVQDAVISSLPDLHDHVVDMRQAGSIPDVLSGFRMAEVLPDINWKKENVVDNAAKTWRAFTIASDAFHLFVEDLGAGKTYEIQGLPLPYRPFSELVWATDEMLMVDRWSQPHYGIHYVINAPAHQLLMAAPFPDQIYLDAQSGEGK